MGILYFYILIYKKVFNNNPEHLFFFTSGHPMGNLINHNYPDSFPELSSGAGTVTIAALDLAVNVGFKNIKIFAADFSYSLGKAYTSGTYLDSLYSINSNKNNSFELQFTKLLYRTELIKISQKKYTTQILNSYKDSLEDFLKINSLEYKLDDNIYEIINKKSLKPLNTDKENYFDFNKWYKIFIENLKNHKINSIKDLNMEDIAILPLMSNLKNHDNNNITGFFQLYKKAIETLER